MFSMYDMQLEAAEGFDSGTLFKHCCACETLSAVLFAQQGKTASANRTPNVRLKIKARLHHITSTFIGRKSGPDLISVGGKFELKPS